ncbi:helix-turn-helix transcriptional regulator [Nonomuraea sp. NPDC049750]|uniref:helix-turn-helix domain-containing protein n=1 Tax=Nonomuraea sp. NPDC049750 TaxID=3154738 RepID=UPI0033D6A7FB
MGTFGAELRRMRMAAGLSLAQLSDLVHYSKGHLSKIENGSKAPSAKLVQMSDAALGANGALRSLAPAQSLEAQFSEMDEGDDEVWFMNLADDGNSWFHPVDRREALAMTASSLLGFGLSSQGLSATAKEPTALEVFRGLFDQFRSLGQTASPAAVLPPVIAQTHVLRALAAQADRDLRDEFLVLGARFAEYAGWMAQESGNDQAALWWTAKAVRMATASNDRELAVYALVRRALVTLYREDSEQTIRLARQAKESREMPSRIRALAAQREAQGHALAGNYKACLESLEEARNLLDDTTEKSRRPVLGSVNLPDAVSMVTGWCLYELGMPEKASEILDVEVAKISPQALRSRARFGTRQALAHAAAGQVDHACALTTDLLRITDVVASATITTDLRRIARELSRWHTHPAVRELYPALTASLSSPQV